MHSSTEEAEFRMNLSFYILFWQYDILYYHQKVLTYKANYSAMKKWALYERLEVVSLEGDN
jgi:hypothetical protein